MNTTMVETRTDEDLVLSYARSRDEDAMSELVARHWGSAYQLAHRLLRDGAAAEDAAQEAFVSLVRGASRFDAGRAFGPWFRTLVLNAARMVARSAGTRRRHEERAARTRGTEVAPVGEERVLATEVAGHLGLHIERLPEEVRFPVVLHYYEGWTHDEVATATGVKKTTTRSRIDRGLEQLRLSLAGAGFAVTLGELEGALASAGKTRAPVPVAPPVAQLERAARRLVAPSLAAIAAVAAVALGVVAAGLLAWPQGAAPTLPVATTGTVSAELASRDAGTAAVPTAGSASPDPRESPVATPASKPLAVCVRDKDGKPVPGAEVVLALVPATFGPEDVPAPLWSKAPHGLTDSLGVASFETAGHRGERAFVFARRKHRSGRTARLELGGEDAPHAITLTMPFEEFHKEGDKGCCFLGLLTAGGKVLGRHTVEFSSRGGTWSANLSLVVDEQGRYLFPMAEPDEELTFTAHPDGPGFAPRTMTIALQATEIRVIDLDFEKGVTISGALTLPADVAVSKVAIGLEDATWTSSRPASVKDRRYTIEDVAPGSYVLVSAIEGFAPRSQPLTVTAAANQEGPLLALGDGAAVSGRVVAPDGGVMARQKVALKGRAFAKPLEAETDDEGRFAFRGIAPGTYGLEVSVFQQRGAPAKPERARQATYTSWVHTLSRTLEVTTLDLPLGDLTLANERGTASLSGLVVGPDGSPVAAVKVSVWPNAAFPIIVETDEKGRFFARELVAGKVWVTAAKDSLVLPEPLPVDIANGAAAELRVVLGAGGVIRGRVAAPAERLKDGLRVSVESAPIETTDPVLAAARKRLAATSEPVGEDGSYRVAGLPPGSYAVTVDGTACRAEVALDAGAERALDLSLLAAVERIDVSVEGLPQDVLGKARVRGRSAPLSRGRGALDLVDPGPATVELSFQGHGSSWSFTREVQVAPGLGGELRFVWPTVTGSLEGQLGAASSSTRVHAFGEGLHATVAVGRDGRFRLDQLPPGSYRVLVGSQDGTTPDPAKGVAVTVAAGTAQALGSVPGAD
jgi:RNA polymerase sigma-70 factor (ECF subfamily)